MKPALRVSEVIEIMDSSVSGVRLAPFRIVFCTADPKRGTGGERIIFDRAVLTQKRKKAAIEGTGKRRSSRTKRYPVNVRNLTSDEIRKVHIELIEELNGHPVL